MEQQVAALTKRVFQLEQSLGQMRAAGLIPPTASGLGNAFPPDIRGSGGEPSQESLQQAHAGGQSSFDPSLRPSIHSAADPAIDMAQIGASQIGASQTGASQIDGSQAIPSAKLRPAEQSLESRIGSQFFNRIGITALLIGAAWFLKLAFDSHWIGPLGRILIGLLAGSGLILWSERFRAKGYPSFSYSLKAVGSGVLYLSLWAAYSVFHLIPAGLAFAAMILVTAWNGFMAWVQDSELLAVYAIVGGFSTPLLLSTGENHELSLLGYLLLLDAAVLALVALRPWSRLLLGAFTGTLFFSLGWYFRFYSDSQFAFTASFAGTFFVLFAIAPALMRSRPMRESAQIEDPPHTSPVLVLLPLANAALAFLEFYVLLDHPLRRWARPWTAVAFAAFYLLLLQLPSTRIRKEQPALLASLHLAFAVVFLTIAIPLEAHGRWITIGWLVEGAALLWAARRLRLLLLRVLAAGSLTLGFVSLLFTNSHFILLGNPLATNGTGLEGPVILNARFATYMTAVGAFAIAAYISAQARPEADATQTSFLQSEDKLTWLNIAAASLLAMNFLLLIAGAQEIHTYWWAGNATQLYGPEFSARSMDAQFSYSAWGMLFGAVLLAIGFSRRSAFLRWQALVLVALTIAKVFLYDIGRLSPGYRVLSFLGLGALLLAVSFVYQRDLLHLRDQQEQPQ